MIRRVSLLIAVLTLVAYVTDARAAQDSGPVLQSSRWPPAAVVINSDFQFLAGDHIRIGAAEADIFVVVDAPDGTVQRLYWIQFEGYPEGIGYTYDYSDLPYADTISGYAFRSDVRYGSYSSAEIRDERDTGTVVGMLRDHGFDVPAPMMRIRMVALDETQENELMVIYLESLTYRGLTVDELDSDAAQWRDVATRLRQRAIDGLHLQNNDTE